MPRRPDKDMRTKAASLALGDHTSLSPVRPLMSAAIVRSVFRRLHRIYLVTGIAGISLQPIPTVYWLLLVWVYSLRNGETSVPVKNDGIIVLSRRS